MERLQRALEVSTMLEPIDPFGQDVEVVPFDDDGNPLDPYERNRRPTTLEFLYRSD